MEFVAKESRKNVRLLNVQKSLKKSILNDKIFYSFKPILQFCSFIAGASRHGGNCPSRLKNLSPAEEPAVEIDQARRP